MTQLRPYQVEAITEVWSAFTETQRTLLVLPTGSGKTVCFARIAADEVQSTGKQVFVLAHREELIDQAVDKIQSWAPSLHVEPEQGERRASPAADIIVASVPTIGQKNGKRLLRFNPNNVGMIICDEAHHSVADSYVRVFDWAGCGKQGGAKLLGVTATPKRGDDVDLGDVYETIAYQKSILDLVRDGWLCRIRAFTVKTKTSIDDVHTLAGDFKINELAGTVNTEERNLAVVRAYRELAADRKRTLCFAVDVAHAEELTDRFRLQGIASRCVVGETPWEERKETLLAFSHGEVPVLTNCMVLTEGYDEPGIDCILMARPTKSPLLFAQCLGRGTRLCDGKKDLLFLDFVDNSKRHKIATFASLFGMPEKLKLAGEDVEEAVTKTEQIKKALPGFDFDSVPEMSLQGAWDAAQRIKGLLEEGAVTSRVLATPVELFTKPMSDPVVAANSNMPWVRMPDDSFLLSLPQGKSLVISQDLLGRFNVLEMSGHGGVTGKVASSLYEAFRWADRWIKSVFPDTAKLYAQDAPWRLLPISDKQILALQRLRIEVTPGMTRGEAANIMTAVHAKRDQRFNMKANPLQIQYLARQGIDASKWTQREVMEKMKEILG